VDPNISRCQSCARFLLGPLGLVLILLYFTPSVSLAQDATQQAPAPPASQPVPTEDASQQPPNSGATLRVKVNLVTIPVVVRDSAGHAVGTLRKEDFELFDDRKPQQITQFSVERSQPDEPNPSSSGALAGFKKLEIPSRFTAILFDDVHSTFQNLPGLQTSSLRMISSPTTRSQRFGIFTASGKVTQDFTDDRSKLEAAIRQLRPNPLPGTKGGSCPSLTPYAANQIVNRHDQIAISNALSEVMGPCGVTEPKMAMGMVTQGADRVLQLGNEQTRMVLRAVSDVVERMSALRGQRTVVVASPSFVITDYEHRENSLIDLAVRSHVVISALDSRGVETDENQIDDYNVLSEFTDGTGGIYFHNNNDLTEGLRRTAAAPEFVYQLSFSPAKLKDDGKYHHVKVRLIGNSKFTVSAREGYFVPKHFADPVQAENNAMNDALFSQAQINDLPIKMQTQFVQGDKPVAKLSVLALVDLRDLPHRQLEGQNANELRMVAAVFDHNGKYLGAIDRKVAVHWLEAKAETRTAADFTFFLDPGGYLIRLVVRDSESQHLSAQDALVQIP
jgi:VWFA-related protein